MIRKEEATTMASKQLTRDALTREACAMTTVQIATVGAINTVMDKIALIEMIAVVVVTTTVDEIVIRFMVCVMHMTANDQVAHLDAGIVAEKDTSVVTLAAPNHNSIITAHTHHVEESINMHMPPCNLNNMPTNMFLQSHSVLLPRFPQLLLRRNELSLPRSFHRFSSLLILLLHDPHSTLWSSLQRTYLVPLRL
jgi:hypothetical protein